MSESKISRMHLVLGLLLVGLVTAVGVQGYYLVQMNERLGAVGEHSRVGDKVARDQPGQNAGRQPPKEDDSGDDAGTVARSANPDPIDAWLREPFDSRTWNPFEEMESMRERMDRMFGRTLGRFNSSPVFDDFPRASRFSPDVDLREESDRFVIHVDLPGIDEGKVDVKLRGQALAISGVRTKSEEESSEDGRVHRLERRSGSFTRVMTLPAPVVEDSLETKMDNGVLSISVRKAERQEPED